LNYKRKDGSKILEKIFDFQLKYKYNSKLENHDTTVIIYILLDLPRNMLVDSRITMLRLGHYDKYIWLKLELLIN